MRPNGLDKAKVGGQRRGEGVASLTARSKHEEARKRFGGIGVDPGGGGAPMREESRRRVFA
jgi:hypothetical protein